MSLQCSTNDPNYPGLMLIWTSLEDPGADMSMKDGIMTITYSDGNVTTADAYVAANDMVQQVSEAIQAGLGG